MTDGLPGPPERRPDRGSDGATSTGTGPRGTRRGDFASARRPYLMTRRDRQRFGWAASDSASVAAPLAATPPGGFQAFTGPSPACDFVRATSPCGPARRFPMPPPALPGPATFRGPRHCVGLRDAFQVSTGPPRATFRGRRDLVGPRDAPQTSTGPFRAYDYPRAASPGPRAPVPSRPSRPPLSTPPPPPPRLCFTAAPPVPPTRLVVVRVSVHRVRFLRVLVPPQA